MSERSMRRLRFPPASVVSMILVAAGILLWMFVSRGLLIVAGLGAFGPGILREAGVLRDQDEFQREASYRAGYHAYLVGGLSALLVLSAIEWGGGAVDESAEWLRLVVVVLWLTWLSSTLLRYWGSRTTAARVLTAFGAFWAVFVVATLIGDWSAAGSRADVMQDLLGTAVGVGVVVPFFGLAWSARRWPRATGLALVSVSLGFLAVFGRRRGLAWSTSALTDVMLIGPVLTSGLALLLDRDGEAGDVDGA